MITDRQPFRILQILPHQLICSSSTHAKFIYRDYPHTPNIIHRLNLLSKLNHPSLLNLCKIDTAQNVGVYFEHYSGTLHKYVSSQCQQFEQNEIINTFKEILDAIEYMISEGFTPLLPKLRNIVITQLQQIKFADDLLLATNQNPFPFTQNQPTTHQIYEALSNLIFQLFFPKDKSFVKSWKTRLKILKSKLSSKNYAFFISIYNKSLLNTADPKKTKKICKGGRMQGLKSHPQKIQKFQKQERLASGVNHEGKENKISQQ